MTRLTIIIPYVGSDDDSARSRGVKQLEETLVSVLENRPRDAQVVLVHDGSYADPYELSDELSIRPEPAGKSICDLVNGVLADCETEVAAILSPGTIATPDWTREIVERFSDDSLGSVSPLVVSKDDAQRIIAVGVHYSAGGARKLQGTGRAVTPRRLRSSRILGPSFYAGFYRVDAVLAVGGFDAQVGDDLADVDLAATLAAVGYRSELAAESCLVADPEIPSAHNFQRGRQQQRFFWRHAAQRGWIRSLLCHPFTVVRQALGDIPHPGSVGQLLGRLVASLEWSGYRSYFDMVHSVRDQEKISLPLPSPTPKTVVDSQPQKSSRRAA